MTRSLTQSGQGKKEDRMPMKETESLEWLMKVKYDYSNQIIGIPEKLWLWFGSH